MSCGIDGEFCIKDELEAENAALKAEVDRCRNEASTLAAAAETWEENWAASKAENERLRAATSAEAVKVDREELIETIYEACDPSPGADFYGLIADAVMAHYDRAQAQKDQGER